jgi:hypothetical protein
VFKSPSPAVIVAFVALLISLTSPAWGAKVKRLIAGSEIAPNAITSAKVKNGSLLRKDFKAGQLVKGSTGPTGPRGLAGSPGQDSRGALGLPGPVGTIIAGSAYASSGQSPDPVLNTDTTMVDIANGTPTDSTAVHTGQVTLPAPGHVYADGEATLENAAAVPARARCDLSISDGTGPNNGLTRMSGYAFSSLQPGTGSSITVPVSGSAAEMAGTYNVALRCASFDNQVNSYSAGLAVYASVG